jgi:hypothetical protein
MFIANLQIQQTDSKFIMPIAHPQSSAYKTSILHKKMLDYKWTFSPPEPFCLLLLMING